ncbi:hypothetical protein GCM10011379_01160 [Filimonas zeae]|uniref:Uncharacterized protein n=2 Tax=Filimonas zeae TaxID=1737353 RepID=A0A917ILD3_9BACT|nr:hypothetical protein GCM10011379_01160 [Filimonas zeae]
MVWVKYYAMIMIVGISPYRIINKQLHNKQAGSIGQKASEYPPAFGIDWHVDDAEGVHLEGELFGFRVLIVEEGDENWVERVLQLPDAKALI